MIYIGIDPGVNTGYAAISSYNNFIWEIETMPILDVMERIANTAWPDKIQIVMEDARLRKWFTGGREKLQGVGSVKRDCQIWQDFCFKRGIAMIIVAPKDNRTKLSPEAFAKITGYTKRTSNHARDAAMLVWGRK